MTTAIHRHDEHDASANEVQSVNAAEPISVEKKKIRVAAIRRFAGLWATRQDIPADGLEYERELRNEWR
jgi:hypothetical protein